MFTSNLIKAAWKIRREEAAKWECGLMVVSWKICLKKAKAQETDLDRSKGYYESLLKKYPTRGMKPLKEIFADAIYLSAKDFNSVIMIELMSTKDNYDTATDVTSSDSKYRILKIA